MQKRISITATLLATLAAQAAWAGDTLRLRDGDVKLVDESSALLIDSLAGAHAQPSSFLAEKRYFVVQFAKPVTEAARAALASQGLETIRYLPDDAYLVRGPLSQAARVRSQSIGVRALAAFRPEWKISPDLAALGDARAVSLEIVAFDADEAAAVRIALDRMAGVLVNDVSGRRIAAQAPATAIADIAALEGVEWLQEEPFFQTFVIPAPPADGDTPPPAPPAYTGYESGTKVMGFEAAWARGFSGEGQTAAMADTGLDVGNVASLHPDFGNFLQGFADGIGSKTWEDPMGHGTHVAGSILATGKASDGKIRGGASSAKLVVGSIWSPILNNLGFNNDLSKLFKQARDAGARVHSNSWGNPNALGKYDDFAHQVDEFMWENPDFLIVFAAGNEGTDKDSNGVVDEGSVTSPGTAKNTLTVGASENNFPAGGQMKTYGVWHKERWAAEPIASDTVGNNPDGLAAFSSRGPTLDLRTKPEIVAPGTNIVSARSHAKGAELLWGVYDDQHLYCGGTSMATPLAAGAATVAREFLVKSRGLANPSAALVKGALMHSAHDLFPGQYGVGATQEIPKRRPNNQEGYGRVDMDALTAFASETSIVDDAVGIATGEVKSWTVHVEPGQGLRATLSYTDAPASASASVALVNDLDLEIVDPAGTVTSLKDRRNNHEMLELASLARGGDYVVTVRGVNVPQGKQGKQPFALLVTHD